MIDLISSFVTFFEILQKTQNRVTYIRGFQKN